MDTLFLIPLSKSIQKCVSNWISKKKSVTASIKISLLDDSITKAAALIKSVDDSAAPLKGYYDPTFYPEALLNSARLNADLADKIEGFKMKGITGADLDALKAQQKQLADPFRSTAKAKIKAAFDASNEALTGASQMNPILEVMAKVDPEGYPATIENWKPIKPVLTLNDTLKKVDSKLPADVAQIIRTNNLKWMTYQFLIRQGSSQTDDTFKFGTLALGTAIYHQAGLDSKAFGILEDSIYRNFSKPWIGPYVEAAYSSFNSKMTKRACEVLSNEDAGSFANHCAWVRP